MKSLPIYLSLIVILLFTWGCKHTSKKEVKEKQVITDMLGRKLSIPKDIKRVICLRAGALRMLVYLDASKYAVGIEEGEVRGNRPYIMAHPELLQLPIIGPSMGGDAELIAEASPELIFVTYSTVSDADALQKQTGIPVVAITCPEFDQQPDTLFASLLLMGQILGKTARADSLISYMQQSIDALKARSSGVNNTNKPSVFVGGISYSGARGILSTQAAYPPFVFTQANNVAASINKKAISHIKGTYIDKEQLMLWNPDLLFIDVSGWQLVQQDIRPSTPLFASLDAVKNNRIYTLFPYNNYAISYEMVLANAWFVGKVLYPQQFADITICEKINEIMQCFLGNNASVSIWQQTGACKQLSTDSL